ncbi:MAG: Helix-turn-helix domain protein [Syntrophorhabdaceae bacterium PtaU1.Bin034]|jgi:excisionase family DNA binding protein|nr:MAG: Helix-turn-helix domain protein [Syntrophorhabdaceae bacterium PtaU1.Bin034]
MTDIDLIPLKEVRDRLRISKATLWRWIKDGKLSTVKLSERKIYVKKTELERLIKEGEK